MLEGVSEADARCRFEPMNCISWLIGHLAWHEQLCWLTYAKGCCVVPALERIAATGSPASTPAQEEMWAAWHAVVSASDAYLDTLTTETLLTCYESKQAAEPITENIGTMLRRLTYHYWYHLGESQAIRQLLQHKNLPSFVGAIGSQVPFRPENVVTSGTRPAVQNAQSRI